VSLLNLGVTFLLIFLEEPPHVSLPKARNANGHDNDQQGQKNGLWHEIKVIHHPLSLSYFRKTYSQFQPSHLS
jgi:hypothetical protein